MVAPTPFFSDRGCHTRIYEEARALQRRGHHVTIVTYHNGNTPPDVEVERIIRIPWYTKVEAGPSWHKFYLDILLLGKTLAVQWRFRADIIHGHLHEGCLIGWVTARFYGIPLLFDYQGSLTEEIESYGFIPKRGISHRIFHTTESFIDHRADAIVTSATSLGNVLERDFTIPSERIHTLLDGVNTTDIIPGPPDPALRTRLGIPNNKKIIAYVGSFSEAEGIPALLRAAKLVIEKMPDVFFLIAGHPNVEEYRATAKELGLEGYVLLPGRVPYEEVPAYTNLGDLLVTTKLQTEANAKLYFYMASGKPIVAFGHSTNREILGDVGLYPVEFTAESFAEKIIEVLNEPATELEARGGNLRKRVVQLFSWDARAEELDTIYHGL